MKCVQIRSFSWSVFPRIWTEYGEIESISPYSVRMRENTDQKKFRLWTHVTQCNLIPFIQNTYASLKWSYKIPVEKDLMKIILLKSNERLKLYIILCRLHVLIIFINYQTTNSFSSKSKSITIKFCKCFSYNSIKVRKSQDLSVIF